MLWSTEARQRYRDAHNPEKHIRARVQGKTVHYNGGIITIPFRIVNELAEDAEILNAHLSFAPATHPNWRLHASTGHLGVVTPAAETREKVTFPAPSEWLSELNALDWSTSGENIPGVVAISVVVKTRWTKKAVRVDLREITVSIARSESFQWLPESWNS